MRRLWPGAVAVVKETAAGMVVAVAEEAVTAAADRVRVAAKEAAAAAGLRS